MSAATAAVDLAVDLSTACGPLIFQKPVRWVSTVVAEAEQASAAVEAKIYAELVSIKAHGGLIPLVESQIQALHQTLVRYGANIETLVKAADADVGPAASEGVILLTGLDNDIRALVGFFNGVVQEVPTSAVKLVPIIAGLQATDVVLRGLMTVFGSVGAAATATTAAVTSVAAGNPATTQKNVAQVISDVKNGYTAAVAGGILPAKKASVLQSLLDQGFQIATLEAGLAGKILSQMTVNVAAPRAQPAPAAALTMTR